MYVPPERHWQQLPYHSNGQAPHDAAYSTDSNGHQQYTDPSQDPQYATGNTEPRARAEPFDADNTPFRSMFRSSGTLRDKAGRQVIFISNSSAAGRGAASVAACLRSEGQALLVFAGQYNVLKALRVLVLANLFVRQHSHALSFVPSRAEPPNGPYETNQMHYRYKVIVMLRPVYRSELPRKTPRSAAAAAAADADPYASRYSRNNDSDGPSSTSLRGALVVSPPNAPHVYDFSVDARQEWKRKRISEDLAFSIADMVYDALVVPALQQQQALQLQQVQAGRRANGAPRSMQFSSDCVQSITLFAGLSLVQRRLLQEDLPLRVACTAYRNTLRPRLDQRDGFVFEVRLMNTIALLTRKELKAPPRHRRPARNGRAPVAKPVRVQRKAAPARRRSVAP